MERLKDPEAHFRPQVDGDLVNDGVYAGIIAEKLGISDGQPTGPLAAYMIRHNLVSSGAGTRLHVAIHGEDAADGISVGGYVTPIAEAVMTLDLNENSEGG
jgi:hypothetical protein